MAIRRRRECVKCERRFTTFEEPERPALMVIKRDGSREPFDREKLERGILAACRKRPVSYPQIEQAVDIIERRLFDLTIPEVDVRTVGTMALQSLYGLDQVAFVRFASVYQDFSTPDEFAKIVENIRSGGYDFDAIEFGQEGSDQWSLFGKPKPAAKRDGS